MIRANHRSARARKHSSRHKRRLHAKVSIVGAGAVGSTLGALLFEKGCTIVSIVSRSPKPALTLARTVRCKRVSTSIGDLAPDTEVLLFAVPDDALQDVIHQCARSSTLHFRKLLAAHTSGVHSIEILRPLQRQGAMIGSLHPVQSFPRTKSLRERKKSAEGIYFGVEAEGGGVGMVRQIVRTAGGKALLIPRGFKPLYHAACVFASNYVVTLLNAVEETSRTVGFVRRWQEVMLPLFRTTVENALQTSPRDALTGPIVRNDLKTIELHLDALQKFAPQLIPLYCVAGIDTARVARQSGSLTSQQFRNVVGLVRQYVRSFETNPRLTKEKH